MATFATMKTSVRNVLRDSEAQFITDDMIGEWLNEAQLDICSRMSLLQTNVAGTTSVTSTITLPADFLRLVSLAVDNATATGVPVIRPVYVSNDVFLSYADMEESVGGDPPTYIFRIYEDVIDIYPALTERDYVMEYIVKPATMTGTDTPEIPQELHVRLINYARAHGKLMEGEVVESQHYMAMYERGLISPSVSTERRFPGPINVLVEPGYFD